jgi:hypothetical protein
MWHTDNIGLGGNVSTTRNYNYALGYLKAYGGRGPGGVIFTLDQDLLRRDIGRRRMPGTDWFSTRFHGGAPEDASDEFQRRRDDLDTDRFETLIKGGLSPFRKYVKKIEIWLPKDRTLKPIPPGEDPMYRNRYTPGDDPDKHYDVKLYGRLMKNNWLKDPVMRATWFAIRRDPRTEVKQELGYQKRHHGVPVDDRRQYDTNHPMYDPSRAIDEQGMGVEQVNEVLNTPATSVQWDTSDPDLVTANFTASNGMPYKISIVAPYMGPDEIDPYDFFDADVPNSKFVEFEQMSQNNKNRGKQGIEGTGSAAEVFGIVTNALLQYTKKFKPSMLYFQSIEPSRQRLYAHIANRMVKMLPGWAVKQQDGANFAVYNQRLLKKQHVAKESVYESLDYLEEK